MHVRMNPEPSSAAQEAENGAHVAVDACWWSSRLAGVAAAPIWLPAATGGMVGSLYVLLNRAGMKRFWRAPDSPLNVVVTGGTRGIGKALAREFLRWVTQRARRPRGTRWAAFVRDAHSPLCGRHETCRPEL
jgi:hypothetical protein